MKRHCSILIILYLCLNSQVWAQNATVRSGDHVGFTRLVLPIPSGARWEVTQVERSVRFSLLDQAQQYDLRQVFNLITRSRVGDIENTETGLAVALACDCQVAPFSAGDRFVALDIASPGVARPTPFVPVERSVLPSVVAPAQPNPAPEDPQPAAVALLPTVTPRRETPTLVPAGLPDLVRQPLKPAELEALDTLQQRLAQELGVATTRGLLTALPGQRPSEPPQQDTSKQSLTPPTPVAPPLQDEAQSSPNNMRISSSMDFPTLQSETQTSQSLSGHACPVNDVIDVNSWADDRPFHQQIGTLRQRLYGEFDQLDRETAITLAKIYLHFGFGAESRQTLSLMEDLAPDERMLWDIAHIMEEGAAPTDSILPTLIDCDTDVALWAMLAQRELAMDHAIDPQPALLALNKLPLHLRLFISPALSDRLLSHGDTEAAATALRNLERGSDRLPSSATLAQAKIAIDEGAADLAVDRLAKVINDNTDKAPEALIELVQSKLDQNEPIDLETARLIEAYAKELKGSTLGPPLRRAHVLALSKSGQFDQAFYAFEELGGKTDEEDAISLNQQLFAELTASASDIIFLDQVFDHSISDIEHLSLTSKIALSQRLLELGFATRAQDILNTTPRRPLNPTRQILMARIALASGEPARAEAELIEMNGDEVKNLRAQAKMIAGVPAEARDLFEQSNQTQAAVRAAWLADARDSDALISDPVLGPVVSLLAESGAISNTSDGMLTRSNAMLEESTKARETLETLFLAPDLDVITISEER